MKDSTLAILMSGAALALSGFVFCKQMKQEFGGCVDEFMDCCKGACSDKPDVVIVDERKDECKCDAPKEEETSE